MADIESDAVVSSGAIDKAMEGVSEAAEFVVDQAEDFAEFTRHLSRVKVQYALLGVALGATVGAIASYYITHRKAELKYRKISDEEISGMREHYLEKTRAVELAAQKRPLKEIIAERGYTGVEVSDNPPMAVQPPIAGGIVDEDEDDSEMAADDVEGPAGVRRNPVQEHRDDVARSVERNVFRDRQNAAEEVELPEWDYHEERKHRSPDEPYVIHYDERDELDYQHVTVTYYDADDVICNEDDSIMDPDDRDRVLGNKNLTRFGHGSNSPEIVYIRNDELELVYEVVKSPNSYAEEVHGFRHEDYGRGNLERMRARERDAQEE